MKRYFLSDHYVLFHCFLALIISIEKSAVRIVVAPLKVIFPFLFLAAFRFFFLNLIMSSFIIMHIDVVFFVFVVFGICDASLIYRLKPSTLDGKNTQFLIKHCICSITTHLSETRYTHIRPFNYVLYIFCVVCFLSMLQSEYFLLTYPSITNFQLCLIFVKLTYWELNVYFDFQFYNFFPCFSSNSLSHHLYFEHINHICC